MKKATRLRLLIVTAIVLVASVIVESCGSATYPTSRPLGQTSTAEGPAVQKNVYLGSHQVVYKLNGRDGSVIWKQALTRSVPLDISAASHFGIHVVDGVLYAFMDQDFYAFNASSGQEIWRQHIVPAGSLTTENLRISNEVIDNGVIYLEHANSTISARSARGGTELWSNYTIQGAFFVARGAVYARVYSETGQASSLYAFDGATGRLRWHFTEQGYFRGDVSAENGVVYDSGNALYALNEQTGQLIWTQKLPYNNQFFISPQVVDGVLYASTGGMFATMGGGSQPDSSDYFHVYAFDARTGSLLWRSAPGYKRMDWIPITDQVIVAARNNDDHTTVTLSAFDAQHGKTLWNTSVASLCTAGGCDNPWIDLASNTLYVVGGGSSQQLEAFDVRTGKKLFEHALSFTQAVFDHGGVSNGTAYVLTGTGWNSTTGTPGTAQRTVEAFSLSTGVHSWQFKPGALKGYQDAISPLILAV